MKKVIIFLCFFSSMVSSIAQNIIYVKQDASTGQQNGTSWVDAFTDLQDALSIAQYNDQIWVATGTYYPTSSNDRTISFNLKNGVKLLGGFNGTEINANMREPVTYPTRLSGNIGNAALITDNTIHVARGKGLDENTLIDGLIFSDGYSVNVFDDQSDPYGAGLYLTGSPDLMNSRPVISNCQFEKNWAGGAGGGLYIAYIDLDDPSQSENWINPILRNCEFNENKTNVFGAALMKQGPSGNSDTFALENCRFFGNYNYGYDGGAIYFPSALNSNILMHNCVFEKNTTMGGSGGGFYVPTFSPGGYTTTIILSNCIFNQNSAAEGGGFALDGIISEQPDVIMNLSVINCSFEGNIAKNSYGSTFLVTHAQNGLVNVLIRSSVFKLNRARSYFTTAILTSDDCTINALVENCSFLENLNIDNPTAYCAAFSAGGTKKINTRINNCVFAHNGNAIFSGGGEQAQVTTDITNCTFFQNGDQPFGKRWYPSFQQSGAQYYNKMNFKNCVIWENIGNPSYMFYNNYPDIINGFGFFLDYCSLPPLIPAVIPNNNLVLGDSIYIGEYPEFMDTVANGFRIDKCSGAINRGSNEAAINANLMQDYDGNPRIRFGRVDLGAFEQQDSCFISTTTNPITLQSLTLSPNPSTSGEMSFQLRDFEGETGHLSIYRINGAVVFHQILQIGPSNLLRINSLPSGDYFVLVEVDKRRFAGKWILQGK